MNDDSLQQFLGAVLGALPSRIAVLDEKGTIIAVNTAWEGFTGSDPLTSPALGLGSNFLSSCRKAAREGSEHALAAADAIEDVLAGRREHFSLEYPDRLQQHWYLLRMASFESAGGREAAERPAAKRLVMAAEDISKRKRAENALYESMAWARQILDSAVDGIITIDEAGIIESVNPAAERMFGYAATELIGRNIDTLMPSPYRDEHESYLARYLATGERKIIGIGREVSARRKDGSTFPIDLAVSEVHLGERRSFMGVVRDITARKEMDEALRRERDFAEGLVETAQAIVLVLDCEGKILRFNRYMEQVSGYRLEEVRGRSWFETFLPERDRPAIREVFADALAELSTSGTINTIVTKDGAERAIEWYNTTLSDASGRVIGILATGQDITERRQLEDQFRQAQKMEAIGRLAGGVAHDFNTLLGSITGYSEMLLDRVVDDGLRRPLEQIRRGAERGAGLTRQLLAFSRRQVLEPRVLDLNVVIVEMDGLLRRLIREDILLAYELDPELRPVKVDAGQFEQVVMNLVVNATDAIVQRTDDESSAGGRIAIATGNVELDESHPDLGSVSAAGTYVALTVSDDGCGMDDATLARVFEPFFSTKEQGKGTGLGLSTVYGIARQSGGGVSVTSAPKQGATFRVYLPRSGEPLDEVEAKPVEAVPEQGSETILLVEDDEMFLELLTEVLEDNGYRVLATSEPAAALAESAGRDQPIDLLISDMVMPGMTGTELARQLLDQRPRMKVLLMSGYTDEALHDKSALAVGGAFLQKPFSTKELTRTVRRVLEDDAT